LFLNLEVFCVFVLFLVFLLEFVCLSLPIDLFGFFVCLFVFVVFC
jgi:hypothetical protein